MKQEIQQPEEVQVPKAVTKVRRAFSHGVVCVPLRIVVRMTGHSEEETLKALVYLAQQGEIQQRGEGSNAIYISVGKEITGYAQTAIASA